MMPTCPTWPTLPCACALCKTPNPIQPTSQPVLVRLNHLSDALEQVEGQRLVALKALGLLVKQPLARAPVLW